MAKIKPHQVQFVESALQGYLGNVMNCAAGYQILCHAKKGWLKGTTLEAQDLLDNPIFKAGFNDAIAYKVLKEALVGRYICDTPQQDS